MSVVERTIQRSNALLIYVYMPLTLFPNDEGSTFDGDQQRER